MIGYTVLGLLFVGFLFGLPLIAQTGLSQAEIDSAVNSYALNYDAPMNGDLVDLPYRLLQKISILVFGLTPYAIKLPSILIGLTLGFLFTLLLNRWFRNNVSLLASSLIVLSTPFLFLAGSGTPLIMIVFWPTLLLWLGSKIQGEKKPKPMYSFLFAVTLLLAIFTPFMPYFAVFCVIFVLMQPHLRFVVRSLPRLPFFVMGAIIVGGVAVLIMNMVNHPNTIMELLFAEGFQPSMIWDNLGRGFAPVFSWWHEVDSVFLAPLLSLPMLALVLIGLFSTTKGFFASRNSIASILLVFTVVITAFNPDAALFFILPVAILVAHGLKYILERWYGLFPENPYARVAAIFPLSVLFGVILIPSSIQYIYGYHYSPEVAKHFNFDLAIIAKNLTNETLVTNDNYDFYKILERTTDIKVVHGAGEAEASVTLAMLHQKNDSPTYQLSQIITSPLRENSDIIYLYTVK